MDREQLEAMVEQATVDCYNEAEAVSGFHSVIDDSLAVPFMTRVLGVEVSVEAVDLGVGDQIVAVCSRDRFRQAIPILDPPLPDPAPAGAEWIEAYRFWLTGSP